MLERRRSPSHSRAEGWLEVGKPASEKLSEQLSLKAVELALGLGEKGAVQRKVRGSRV